MKTNLSKFSKKFFSDTISSRFYETTNRTGLKFNLTNKSNALNNVFQIFSKNDLKITYFNSIPNTNKSSELQKQDFFIDLAINQENTLLNNVFDQLSKYTKNLELTKIKEVPWFPTNYYDLNKYGRVIISSETEESKKHPVFKDSVYRKRRDFIANISNSYYMEMEENIPNIDYTTDENWTWGYMWDNLKPLHIKNACQEYNENFSLFEREAGFSRDKIPQLSEISKFLKKRTRFIYRPVAGMLSQREFLNGLAFRVFHSTQYIRHRSDPLYTPEPDVIHEIMGHSIMFADKDFADFSQAIGLASLGASDEDLVKLGNIYWFTVEFGILLEKNQRKIFGAGILGSPVEMEWASSDKPNFYEFDFNKVTEFTFSTTELQTNFFIINSFAEMKEKVLKYISQMKKPFNVSYNVNAREVEIDRAIVTRKESDTPRQDELLF